MRRRSLFLLVVGLVVVSLMAGCLSPSFVSKSPAKVTSPRDLIDYSSLDYKAGEILVKANFGADLTSLLARQDSMVLHEWPEIGWVVASVPVGESEVSFMEKLKAYPEVLLVEPSLIYTLPDPQLPDLRALEVDEGDEDNEIDFRLLWGLENINAEAAWEITIGSPDVIVAIVDTGVQMDHPEFADKVFVDPYDACIFDPTDPTQDDNGHGTHVAGIAADDGRSGKIAGVAWESPIKPIRVMDNAKLIYNQYLVEAMVHLGDYAKDNPDKRIVTNMSIGGRGYSFAFKDAIDYAAEQGVLLITSAGNDNKRVMSYPSAYNGVVSVAASTPHNVKSDFSTTGWWNSVAAPGVKIYSTYKGSAYEYLQGTSMASPYVTGAAALLLAQYPDLTPLEIKNQLEQTARGKGFTEELGYGIIDMEAMLGELKPMMYGALRVETDLGQTVGDLPVFHGQGAITIYNPAGELISYGSTGADGGHNFMALLPGSYTVALTYWDVFKGEYVIQQKTATVQKGVLDTLVTFEAQFPELVFEDGEQLGIESGNYRVEIPVVVSETGMYTFQTSYWKDGIYNDTLVALYDEDDNEIAFNDDFGGLIYSAFAIKLQPGTYELLIMDYNKKPLCVNLDINRYSIN